MRTLFSAHFPLSDIIVRRERIESILGGDRGMTRSKHRLAVSLLHLSPTGQESLVATLCPLTLHYFNNTKRYTEIKGFETIRKLNYHWENMCLRLLD